MGHTVWFRVEKEKSPLNSDDDHSIMCHADKELDRLCKKLEVRKISEFFDSSALASEYADEDLDEEWFDPKAGLATVEALLAHLEANPKDLTFKEKSKQHWRAQLLEELSGARDFLKKAAAGKVRFHFLLVS